MAEALTFARFKSFGPYNGAWEDVKAHCRNWDGDFKQHGRMTETHENTHQVNSELRGKSPSGTNAFYILDDRVMHLREPKVTLADVAARVKKRGPVFDLYLVQSRKWWNTQPLYVLDEAVAYTNGAIAGEQAGGVEWGYEADRAREMTVYAWALIRAIEDLDPDYPDLELLVAFVNYNATRLPDYKVRM